MICERSSALLSGDLISLGNILKVCDMETIMLGAHLRRAAIVSDYIGDSIFCHFETDFSFHGRFVIPPQWCVMGCVHRTLKASGCSGMPICSDTAFTVMPAGTSEFILGPGSRVTLVLMPLQRLQRKFAQLVHPELEVPARLLGLFNLAGTALGVSLRLGYESMRERVAREHAPGKPAEDMEIALDRLLENHLLAGLSAPADDRPHSSRGRRAHYQIVQRAEQYMRENMRRVIYLDEMCNAAGVSERALRYAFDDVYGVSPNRYLCMLRLCTAFRALVFADASRRSVKSVALSCGLWDLSRFAESYRQMFGELPRDTLMREPPADMAPAFESRNASATRH